MHRTIEITVPTGDAPALCKALVALDDVIGVAHHRGASIKPPGDVIVVHTLNRGADAVLRTVERIQADGTVSIVTAEVASIIDEQHRDAVGRDVDEALWEEMETGLRHQGRITQNFVLLMALGGAVATVGLVSEPVPQAIVFVASALVAPGFEPIAKIALGGVLGRWAVLQRGLLSTAVGYLVLVGASAATFALLLAIGAVRPEQLAENPEVRRMEDPTALEILTSVCGAIAGMLMLAAYRRTVIAGALMLLILIPAAALVGAAAVIGDWELARQGAQRFVLDALLVLGCGAAVVAFKQAVVHRRRPLV